ncbi:hypothetical protein D3C71_1681540 [compost metagenome]
MAGTYRSSRWSSSRMLNSLRSRITLGDRYCRMKLSSLKLLMANLMVESQSLPAMSGNQWRSSSVGFSHMRRMSVYIANPSA